MEPVASSGLGVQRDRQDLDFGSEWVGASGCTLVSSSVMPCVSAQPKKITLWCFTLGSSTEVYETNNKK